MDRYRMLPNYHYYDAEGVSPLTIGKSIGKPLRDLKIYGESVQDGTPTPEAPVEIQSCGDKTKNLVDISALVGAGFSNTTITTEGNTLTLHSSSSHTYTYISADTSKKGLFDRLKPSTTYRIRYSSRFLEGSSSNSQGRIVFTDTSSTAKITFYIGRATTAGQVVTYSGTFKTPADMSEWHQILIYGAYGDGSRTEIIDWIVTEESEMVDTYEPYGYKIPVKVSGKNLIDLKSITLPSVGLQNLVKTENTFSFETTISPYSTGAQLKNVWLSKGTYRMSGRCSSTSGLPCGFILLQNGAITHNYAGNGINQKFTISESGYYDIGFYKSYSDPVGSIATFSNVQLELGSSATAYEPYVEPETYNIYLKEPLRKIGGRADYVDFKRGKVVRYVKVEDDTGTLSLEESLSALEAPTEEDISLTEINTNKGADIITVGTTIPPSNIAVQYYK